MDQKPKHTDEELRREFEVIKASVRDPRHFEILYNRYYTQIFRYVWSRVQQKSLAADLVSEVFYKALLNLHQYRFRNVPFSAWLYRIAMNELAQYFRKQKKERIVPVDIQSLRGLWKEMNMEDQSEKVELLFTVMQRLDPPDMNLLELRIFEERPFKEVGEILGITENNAKVRFYRLVDKLAAWFKEMENP